MSISNSLGDRRTPPSLPARLSSRWLLGRQLAVLDQWPPPDEGVSEDPVLYRLNWAIKWHTLAYLQANRWYTAIKAVQIAAAATIPVLTAIGGDSFATKGWVAGLGGLVVVLEGIQQLKKYGQNALLWGQGKEALKRQHFLFKEKIQPYGEPNARELLAQRVEEVIGREVGKWAGTAVEVGTAKEQKTAANP
jgi:hypothetical protein